MAGCLLVTLNNSDDDEDDDVDDDEGTMLTHSNYRDWVKGGQTYYITLYHRLQWGM